MERPEQKQAECLEINMNKYEYIYIQIFNVKTIDLLKNVIEILLKNIEQNQLA